jgi:hypothetical protein
MRAKSHFVRPGAVYFATIPVARIKSASGRTWFPSTTQAKVMLRVPLISPAV